jgi:hypothetical protein
MKIREADITDAAPIFPFASPIIEVVQNWSIIIEELPLSRFFNVRSLPIFWSIAVRFSDYCIFEKA